jgi:hypothetical protein
VTGTPLDRHKGDESTIDLQHKDVRKLVSLAFYSNSLAVYFSIDSVITHATLYQLKLSNGAPVKPEPIFATAQKLQSLFKNEFLPLQNDINQATVNEILIVGDKNQMGKWNKET